MRKFCVAVGVLAFLICSFPAYSTDVKPARTDPQEISSNPAAAESGLPDEITMESSEGYVVLPHDVHIKGVKLKCAKCHHQIRAEGLDTPHPEYLETSRVNCQTCHDVDTKGRNKYYSCSECHHSEPNDSADETLSSKVVIHKSCWKCHDAGTGAEASAGCSDCHVKEES